MKLRAGLVGLGVNSANYYSGFKESNNLELVVVSDLKKDSFAYELYKQINFVNNYQKFLEFNLDVVFIVTPPKTHFEISKFFLSNNVNVVLEKPPVLEIKDYYSLMEIAKKNNTKLATVYHWTFGQEVTHFKLLLEGYGSPLRTIVNINDPYTKFGEIIDGRYNLGGSWLDSGSNALSMINYLFDNLKPELITSEFNFDNTKTFPIYSKVDFKDKKHGHFEIVVDWQKQKNYKITKLEFTNNAVTIDHTKQKILLNGSQIALFNDRPRLENHYYYVLVDFSFKKLQRHSLNNQLFEFLYEVNENEKNRIKG